jgi:CheY-like chemotaxis protein
VRLRGDAAGNVLIILNGFRKSAPTGHINPIDQFSSAAIIPRLHSRPNDEHGSFMANPKSILLIEDNDIVRRYYADRLRQLLTGCHIFEAVTGQTGLDLFQWQTIDCVILDLSLPDMSGFEVLLKLVPVAAEPLVPVIVLTSFDHRDLLEAAECKGAFVALQKDRTAADELATHIRRAMTVIPVEKKLTAPPSQLSVSA